ncbi:MAG: sulfotransferase, partial [Ectothiorhodospiraceae bacterium]|nr:sulfotransferase [Ectothiorhodospiraceae bacterium]
MMEFLKKSTVVFPGYPDQASILQTRVAHRDQYHVLRAELDPDRLISIARQQAGLEDFGDDRFMEPYRMLLDCVCRDVDFSRQGLHTFRQHVIRCLVNRLRIHRDFTRHPEIFDEDVSDPLVVIGMPRTGTTKMQRILSSLPDSDVQRTCLWQMLFPAPFPHTQSTSLDPRVAATQGTGITS